MNDMDLIDFFQKQLGSISETPELVPLFGDHKLTPEFFNILENLMVSHEINSCAPGRFASQPKVVFSPNVAIQALEKLLDVLNSNNGHQTQSLVSDSLLGLGP